MEQQSPNDSASVDNMVEWNILCPLLNLSIGKKEILKIFLLTDNVPGHPRALMKIH